MTELVLVETQVPAGVETELLAVWSPSAPSPCVVCLLAMLGEAEK